VRELTVVLTKNDRGGISIKARRTEDGDAGADADLVDVLGLLEWARIFVRSEVMKMQDTHEVPGSGVMQ